MSFRKGLVYGIVGASLFGASVSEARTVGSGDSLDSTVSADSFVYVPEMNFSSPLRELDSSLSVQVSKPPIFVADYELNSGDATYDEIRFNDGKNERVISVMTSCSSWDDLSEEEKQRIQEVVNYHHSESLSGEDSVRETESSKGFSLWSYVVPLAGISFLIGSMFDRRKGRRKS